MVSHLNDLLRYSNNTPQLLPPVDVNSLSPMGFTLNICFSCTNNVS